jgi:hypothetical protein
MSASLRLPAQQSSRQRLSGVCAHALLAALLLSLACGTPPRPHSPEPVGAHNGERARRVVEVEGDPAGLWWDDTARTLYMADHAANRILTWTDAEGFATWREMPGPSEPGLGQLLFTRDGTLVATRFGPGSGGAVLFVPPAGEPQAVPGLDSARQRLGLSATAEGRIFDSWFVPTEHGQSGRVSELALSGKETDVITGLKQPTGVLIRGERLFVSEHGAGQILSAPLADLAAHSVFASVEGADQLAPGPDGSLFAGSTAGSVYQVGNTGSARVLESGFQQVRGVAYDPTFRRVFVADHDRDEQGGVRHLLHVLPLP